MQVGPDPYARQRRWWPILLRMARQLYWTWWVLAGLGLLSKASPLTRWLERRFVEVEHGLRCLLIIKASGSRRFVAGVGVKADERPGLGTSPQDGLIIETPTDNILGPLSGYRRVGFSLTLSGFDEPSQQHPPFDPSGATSPASGGREFSGVETVSVPSSSIYGGSTREAGDGGTKVTPLISPADNFAQRLAAIESVFNDADGYAMRIAKRVYARGGRLIRLIAQQLTDIGFSLDPGWPQSVDAGPQPIPILDSS